MAFASLNKGFAARSFEGTAGMILTAVVSGF